MKVNSEQIHEAAESLRKMGARRIILFGSMIDSPEDANDIDIAVEGIPLNQILNADVAVCEIFETQADLISREENPAFYDIIKNYGKIIYEERQGR